jgi:hypothetical protein
MHVLRASAGKGMTILGRQGNFTAPRKMIDQLNPDQVVKYLLEPTVTAEQPNLGKADANFPKRIPRTRSREHSIEVEQWLWVRIWDKAYEEMCQCNSSSELKSSSGLATLLDRWTTSYKVLHDEPTDHEIEDELKKTSISGRRRVRNVHMSRKHLKLQDRGELPDRPK